MDLCPEFSHIVRVSDLGASPLGLNFSATKSELTALQKRLGVKAVKALNVQAFVTLLGNGDVKLSTSFDGVVAQTCVVTNKPLDSTVKGEFTIIYSPEVDDDADDDDADDEGIFENLEDHKEPPEVLMDEKIDVGEAVIEQFSLEIEPFPRVQGAVFDGYVAGPMGDKEIVIEKKNPFAILSQLQTKEKK